MAYAEAGIGLALRLAYSPGAYPAGNAETIPYPSTTTIPDGSFTESYPLNNAENVSVMFTFGAAPGAISSVNVLYASDPKMLDAFTLDTVTPGATDTLAGWSTSVPLNGFVAFENTSGETMVATINKLLIA